MDAAPFQNFNYSEAIYDITILAMSSRHIRKKTTKSSFPQYLYEKIEFVA